MTIDGYKQLDEQYTPLSIYVYLNDETKVNETISKINEKFKDKIDYSVNYVEAMEAGLVEYVSLISIISVIMIIITLLLIYLILYILISSIIQKRKLELGIFKAIGYENKQLIIQLVGGFVPSTIVFSIFGLLTSYLLMNKMYESIFGILGAYKISFEYPIMIYVIVSIALIISTILIGIILARKIKKISVYSLIKD